MAEVVHRKLESMLPELEELERVGIFNRSEIREIVRKRRKFEYRMLRRPAKKEDFLQAIQYELDLEVQRKRRKEKYGIVTVKQAHSEYGFTSRVHGLFQRVLKKFKGDVGLWSQYALFCQKIKHYFALSKALAKALAVNPRCAELWVLAAKTEHEGNRNVDAARTLLQKGIRANAKSQLLWHEMFRLELLHVDRVKRRRDVLGLPLEEQDQDDSMVTDEFMNYRSAIIVYQAAIKAIPTSVDFRLGFLPVLDNFDDVETVNQEIYSNLTRDFPNCAQCWDAVARQHIRTLDLSLCKKDDLVVLCGLVEAVYCEGLHIMTENRDKLWILYIKWFCEWSSYSQDKQRKKKLKDLCKSSFSDPQVTEELMGFCLKQILSADSDQEEVDELCCLATTKFPRSSSLWKLRLSILSDSSDDEMFRNAIKMAPECQEVWQHWIEWSVMHSEDRSIVRRIFEDSMSCGVQSVSVPMSLRYIEWLLMSDGIKAARKLYRRLLSSRPVALEVYRTCVKIEQAQESKDVKCIRTLYEAAVLDHGSSNPGLWLEYIKSELSFDGGVTRVSSLYWRAKKNLHGSLVSTFVTQHSLINIQ